MTHPKSSPAAKTKPCPNCGVAIHDQSRTCKPCMYRRLYGTLEARFWGKVAIGKPDDCWEWQATVNVTSGYGAFTLRGKDRPAHRVAYELRHDAEPPDDLFVCHTCDNRRCVNPAHLFLGTRQDNVDDMMRKGRLADMHGEKSPIHKLTEKDVRYIRSVFMSGSPEFGGAALARKFGVTQAAVWNVIHRKTWRHVE